MEGSSVNATNTRNTNILVIATEQSLAENLLTDLQTSGYQTILANNTKMAVHQAMELKPYLIVIDKTLGTESGFMLCVHLRKLGNSAPILLLVARDGVEERAACLEAGATDYFLKPYRKDQFLQLVKLYLSPHQSDNQQLIKFADLTLDLSHHHALRSGRKIELTMKEYELLKYLMEHPNQILSREDILENVWGYDFMGESNVIEVYIRYLRLKIEQEGEKRLIQTVRGVGYVLRES